MLPGERQREGVSSHVSTENLDQLEQWYKRREYARVIFQAGQLLQNPACKSSRGHILHWKARAHIGMGSPWFGEAISCLREGMAAAGKDRPLKARIMATLAFIYSRLGDCSPYPKLMNAFAAISRDRNPEVLRWGCFLWFNYGVTLDNCFRLNEAKQAYTEALALARAFHIDHMVGTCLHNLGGDQLALGQLAEAAVTIAQAEAMFGDDGLPGAKKLSRRAEYALAAGDLVSSQQWVTSALIHPGADDMTKADIYYTWAQTLLALNRPADARERALLALEHAFLAVHYPGIHKANRLLQQLGNTL
jgi:tetratricopeptide (TPR) repeat protein